MQSLMSSVIEGFLFLSFVASIYIWVFIVFNCLNSAIYMGRYITLDFSWRGT